MRLVFLLAFVTAAMAGGEDNKGFSGSFSQGNGQGYGYGGSFSSGGGSPPGSFSQSGQGGFGGSFPAGSFAQNSNNGQGFGYAGSFGPGGSFPPGVPQFNFNNLFTEYFDIFKKFNQDLAANRISAYSYSITNADSNNKIQAMSSLTFGNKGLQNQQNRFGGFGFGFPGGNSPFSAGGFGSSFSNTGGQDGFTNTGGQGGFSSTGGQDGFTNTGGQGGFSNTGGQGGYFNTGGQGASASASIGPGGSHQSAAVNPQNPNMPNINNRFGAPSGEGSSYGVFTSSQSGSSNINGKPSSFHQASTTINDNGKVTTYTVHNP